MRSAPKCVSPCHGARACCRWFRRRKKARPNADDEDLRAEASAAVELRYVENYAWFAHRVRRHIPPPKELEAALVRVVETFAACEDARTGMQLFTPKTFKVHRAIVAHIRKGCVSDFPDYNYYFLVGTTKDGFPIYKSVRGTSALEGYHHHLRLLVAQCCMSPRLLISLLRCFN